MKTVAGTALIAALTFVQVVSGVAQSTNDLASPEALKRMSLEELLEVNVTSVSRSAEPASRAAAAVEVITPDEIERSGAASVQDVLRLATGVQVSRFSGHSYAISSRGFTSLAANKMQVMQDGRSLYSPLFSGVFWDAYDTLLDDLDRIEVIRGPGAAMWGANAVNGVINIISKDARDTQGTLIKAGGGSEERGFAAARYGGKLDEDTYFRVYGQYWNRDAMEFPSGASANDSSQEALGGFRIDSQPSDQNKLTLQGELFWNQFEINNPEDAVNNDGNVLGRWTRQVDAGSELQLQVYYDHFHRDVPGQFGENRDTGDIDLQYRFQWGARQSWITGIGYRISGDQTKQGGTIQFDPRGRIIHIVSGFVQDDIVLVPDRLALVLGSRFEYDSLNGFEPQPTVRLSWTPTEHQTAWAAVSRAVRMPARIDEDVRFVPVPGVVSVQGNPDFNPEKLLAYELGYRIQPHHALAFDLAAFYNRYEDLRSLEPTPPTGLPLVQQNLLDAETYGVEISAKYQVLPWWRVSASYTCLQENLLPRPESRDPTGGTLEGNDAHNLFSLWSSMDLPHRISLDGIIRYVDSLPHPFVPGYITMDVRLAWKPWENVEIAIVGQNLFQPRHLEFGGQSPTSAEVQRGVYGKVTWRF